MSYLDARSESSLSHMAPSLRLEQWRDASLPSSSRGSETLRSHDRDVTAPRRSRCSNQHAHTAVPFPRSYCQFDLWKNPLVALK